MSNHKYGCSCGRPNSGHSILAVGIILVCVLGIVITYLFWNADMVATPQTTTILERFFQNKVLTLSEMNSVLSMNEVELRPYVPTIRKYLGPNGTDHDIIESAILELSGCTIRRSAVPVAESSPPHN